MHHVTFLLFPNIITSSLSFPLEMLNAADNMRRSQTKTSERLTVKLAAQKLEPINTSGGLKILPDTLLTDVKETELVIIPALWRNPLVTLKKNPAICEWIKKTVTPETRICAVGTGSSFLAESNILHKKAATTHWLYFSLMEKLYPDVEWKRHHLITQSGNIYCAGSVNSIADLTIHFIEQSFSTPIARKVESQFSPEIRQAYSSHLFDESADALHSDELIAAIQEYIHNNFSENLDFEKLSHDSGIAYRSLQRRFNQATGFSPLQYQQHLRVQNAKELLKNTNLNIQDIAVIIGYIDASHFSQVFKKHTEQTPKTYRRTVRGKLFSARSGKIVN